MPAFPGLEDEGEFILSAFFCGVSHPPGFPLFNLLAYPFSWLPLPSPAMVFYVFTILLAILGLNLFWSVLEELGIGPAVARFTTLLLGASPYYWEHAITVEVYLLHAVLFLACLQLSLQVRKAWSYQRFYSFMLLFGLSLSNHWPLCLLSLPTFLLILARQHAAIRRHTLPGLACLTLGLTPYLHLYTAQFYSDFLFTGPLNSLGALWGFISRQEYRLLEAKQAWSWFDYIAKSYRFLLQLLSMSFGFGLLAGIYGWLRHWRQGPSLHLGLLWSFFASNLFLWLLRPHVFSQHDVAASYQLVSCIILFIYLGFACASWWQPKRWWAYTWGPILLSAYGYGWLQVNQQRDTFAADYASLILASLPPHAVLLVNTDADANPIGYAHYAEKKRYDLLVTSAVGAFYPNKPFDRQQDFTDQSHLTKLRDFIKTHLTQGRRVFATSRLAYFDHHKEPSGFTEKEYGIFREYTLTDAEPPPTLAIETPRLKQFLDHVAAGGYSRRWNSLRDTLIANFCHAVLRQDQWHPLLNSHIDCQYVYGQHLNSVKKDRIQANQVFFHLLHTSRRWGLEKRSGLVKDYLVNKVQILQGLTLSKASGSRYYQSLVTTVENFSREFPTCDNKAALNLYQLALQLPVKVDWQHYNQYFAHCGWAGELKPLLEKNRAARKNRALQERMD